MASQRFAAQTRSPLTLIPAREARRILAEAVSPLPAESVPLGEAVGRVLAEPLLATEDVPAFPRAVMDGFAVRSEDVEAAGEGAPVRLRIVGSVGMGDVPVRELGAGEAIAVATGAHLPPGADAVVMSEHVQAEETAIAVERPVESGRNVMHVGEDLGQGSLVLPSGRRLRPQDLAALAAFGVTAVRVHRRPRVAVLSTGTELCRPEERPPPGKVRDVNQHALAAHALAAGGIVTRAGIAPDEPTALQAALAPLMAGHDLVILSGGTSIGGKDYTADVLTSLGARLLFHGIDVRPGKPTLAARAGRGQGALVLGLPGVPTATLIISQVFVRPVLWRLGGEAPRDVWTVRRPARLRRPHASLRGREDYLRVRLEEREDGVWAEPVAAGPAALSSLLAADGVVVVPEDVEGLEAGASVEVCLF